LPALWGGDPAGQIHESLVVLLPALSAAAAGLIQPRWHVEIDASAALAQISCTGVDLEGDKIIITVW
jgi:hypothetical protein